MSTFYIPCCKKSNEVSLSFKTPIFTDGDDRGGFVKKGKRARSPIISNTSVYNLYFSLHYTCCYTYQNENGIVSSD